ncbi:MAG: hypothetical protein ACTSX8_02805 [Alphaproteobacteria bacterium]
MAAPKRARVEDSDSREERVVEMLRRSSAVKRAEETLDLLVFVGARNDDVNTSALLSDGWLHRDGNAMRFAKREVPNLAGVLNDAAARHRLEMDPQMRGVSDRDEAPFYSEFAEDVEAAMKDTKRGEAEMAALAEEHLEMVLAIGPNGILNGYRGRLFGLRPDLPNREAQNRLIEERKKLAQRRAQIFFGAVREAIQTNKERT